MRARRLALAIAVLVLLPAAPASGAIFDVTNTPQLVTAVSLSNGNAEGDTINVAAGTYSLPGELVIQGEDLTIQGDGADVTVVRSTGRVRVFNINNTNDDVDLIGLHITNGDPVGNGGGILNQAGSGDLRVERSTVLGNRATTSGANAGGGGIYNAGTGLTVVDSNVSRNSTSITGANSGGGGIWSSTGPTIENTTFDGDFVTATGIPAASGGGALFTLAGGVLRHVTMAGNASSLAGGGFFNAHATTPVTLANSILAFNDGGACAGPVDSIGNNIDGGSTCALDELGDQSGTDPRIGPLDANGGPTRTRALLTGSPAINNGNFAECLSEDQRGVSRSVGGDCDIGAFEFDGQTVASIPDCSPTGQIPLTMTAAPNEGVDSFHYRIDGGPEQVIGASGTEAGTVIELPEGRRSLEYWGQFTNGEQADHDAPGVLVDKTDPQVSIQSEQRRSVYVITRRATVDVNAGDALSGLVVDPSADGERVATGTRGAKTVTKTATDLCGNQDTTSLSYRVLGPGLGTRAVLEPLGGRVRFRPPGSARVAQKGGGFVTLSQPREIPVGSLLDTSRGTVRLTSSRSRRATAIQDGNFIGGVFQVLQARKRSLKGLTTLRLKGSSFAPCRAGASANAALSRRAIRRLRGNATGRFRTRGRFSAATVRGTKWTVTDRCDGTLTRVTRGRVAVRDFRRSRTIVLTRGKSFLAKAPGVP